MTVEQLFNDMFMFKAALVAFNDICTHSFCWRQYNRNGNSNDDDNGDDGNSNGGDHDD